MISLPIERNLLVSFLSCTWCCHLHPCRRSVKKLVAFCGHFVLMWVVALSAAVVDMEGRKMQFCSMASAKQSSRWDEKTGSLWKQELASPKLFSLKTCAAKKQRNRWRSTYGNLLASDVAECCSLSYRTFLLPRLPFWLNHGGLLLSGPLLTLPPFLALSFTLHGVNRVILEIQQRPRTVWDLYYVKFAQHQQLSLKENFHYPLAAHSLRHVAERLWYHCGGMVSTCFKVSL